MKALVLDQPGSPETLHIAQMPDPLPGEGEVRVNVHAVGLNPADYKFAQRGFRSWRYPFIPGLDVAGTIDSIGKNVTGWKIGDAVYYHGDLSKPGGFAEWAIATAHTIAPLPQNLSFTEAAALPCAGFTAYQTLYRKLHVQQSQTILIHGGAGGVGGFAVQLAALGGLQVISTCSPHNFEWVGQLGAAEVIDYNTEDVASKVYVITKGRGVDAIVDTVSSASATAGLEMLAFGGAIACVNGLPDFSRMKSFGKAISVHDVALGGAHLSGDRVAQSDLAQIGKDFGNLASSHKINPMLQEVIRLEEIPHALARLSQGHARGKIVAQIQP
ncbi:MAG TPA: zinc-binding dehydrogenase [Candidatus Obscuribacterales bacterium]